MLAAEELEGSAAWRYVIFFAFAAVVGTVSLVRYELFRSGPSLGYYLQAMYALAVHGPNAHSSWTGLPILGPHGPLILVPLSYLLLVGGPGLILLLQAAAAGFGFFYLDGWMTGQAIGWERRRLVGWAYLLSTLLWGVVVQDFHPVLFAIPALMAAATLMDRGRIPAGLVALTLALLCSFEVLPVALLLGIVLAIRQRPLASAYAMGWTVVATALTLSATHQRLGVLLSLPTHALTPAALTGHAWFYLGYLLGPVVVFGASKNFWWLLPGLWVMLLNIWTGGAVATSPFAAGSALAAPFLLLALAGTVGSGRFYRWWRPSFAAYALLFVVFLGHEADIRHLGPPLGQLTAVTDGLADIPAHATVVAEPYAAAHLAVRGRLLPLVGTATWPAHSYVVVDGAYPGPIAAGVLPPVLLRLEHTAKIRYSYEGMWVFYLPHAERGL